MQIITTHLNADFDGLASMVAAKKLYPEAELVFSGSQERNLREFLGQSDGLHYQFKRQKQVDFSQVERLILVDTRQAGRIGNLAACLDNPGIEVHLYDHHPDTPNDLRGTFEEIRPVGSTSTVFVQLFQERKMSVSNEEATLLLMGIYEDTGSFSFSTTTPADLEAAAWLLGKGANLDTVSQFISHELTADQVILLHQLINSANRYTISGVDIVVATISLPEYVDEFALLVRRFLDMENLNSLFSLAAMRDRIYFIARSRIPEVNVGEIARELGGGGHASAASATIKDLTLVEAEEKLIQLLHKHIRPVSLAGELMSSPVISVGPDITIHNANQILTRYNVTVLPVVTGEKAGQEILGMISRRVVEKSIFHGLGNLPVSEYMTTEVKTLPTTATLADIQELIIEHRQRLIPVVEGTALRGVITRTDLLNLLVNDPSHLPKDLLDAGERPSVERHRNLNNLMVEMLSKEMIVLLRTIGEIAEKNGCTVYVVGGFVRDLMLRIKNYDLDIVVEGDGIDFARKLVDHFKGKIRTHEKFSTAVVILPDGFKIDVATARLEYYEYPAALPTVELSSIKLDLYRRDFTINAMAIHLNPERFGTLVDFFNSQNDIKERRIRILHNLSFVEDPTRIFRAIRFEQRMGFVIGSHTEKLIKNAVKMDLFGRVCGRRCFNELKYILSEDNPLPALRRMASFNLLKFIRKRLRFDRRMEELLTEAMNALSWHKLLYLDEKCRQWLVYLMILFCRVKLDEAADFCRDFELSARYTKMFLKEKAAADRVVRIMNRGRKMRPSEIYRLLRELNHEGLVYVMALAKTKATKKAVSHYVTHLRHVVPLIQGGDLKALGYKTGPLYREILDRLLAAKLDGAVATRDDELKFLKQHYPLGKESA
jgi:tRNA nucleotidyltransferase (CCA-adding enzyme)